MRYAPRSAALLLVTGLTGTPIAMPAPKAQAQDQIQDQITSQQAATPLTLRLDVPAGRTIDQVLTMGMQMQQEAQGMQMNVNMDMRMELTQAFEAVNSDGNLVSNLTIDRVKMEMDAPVIGEATLDTENPDLAIGTPLENQVRPLMSLTQRPIRRVLSPLGEVLSTDLPGKAAASDQATQMELLAMIRNITPTFPENPLNIGDTWTQQIDSTLPGNAAGSTQSNLTWKLTSVDGSAANFALSGSDEVRATPQDGTTVQMSIASNGTATIDAATGVVQTLTLTQNNTGTVSMNNGEVTMPMTSETTIKLESSR